MKTRHLRLPGALLLMASLLGGSGCMTCNVLDDAQTQSHQSDIGEVIVDRKAQPARYAWLVLAIPGDVVTSPIQAIAYFCTPRGSE